MTPRALTAARILGTTTPGDSIVFQGGRVIAVTRRDQLGGVETVDFPGATVVPAFVDSHIHPIGYAALLAGTSLNGASNLADLAARLRSARDRIPAGGALMAQRLDDSRLGRLPTRVDLDRAVSDRPVLAYRYCGHIAVANTAALELAGVGPDTADPVGGSLDRDEAGAPTGVLRETAVGLVSGAIDPLVPPPGPDTILGAMEGLVATGMRRIGAIVAGGQPLWCGVGNELESLCGLAPDLPLDVDVLVIAETPDELVEAATRVTSSGGRLHFRGWKAFADGSLGGHTAAMWHPFEDKDTAGTLRLDPEWALMMARHVLDMGAESAIHAIGDRAIDSCLDVYQRLIEEGFDPARMRIEHVSVASDEAIGRMADLGVVASVQPAFLTSEANWVPARLGNRPAYRFATMHRAGVSMIGGSDCPVERPDPLVGISAAVNRTGWDDHEQLDLPTALSLFSATDLSPGGPADLVVLDRSPDDPSATILAVYHDGQPQALAPVPWPG